MSSSVFPVPLSGIQEGIIAAKGDLIVGTANDTPGILSVGTNTHVLTADSTTATGLKWAAPASPTFVGAAAYMSNNSVSYTQNVQATMSFTDEDYDSDGFWALSPNPSRLTIPTGKGGKYLINALWRTVVGSDSARLFLKKNGSTVGTLGFESGHFVIDPSMALNNTTLNASVVLSAVATDYFELTAQTSFATQSSATWCRFSISYLGA